MQAGARRSRWGRLLFDAQALHGIGEILALPVSYLSVFLSVRS